MLIATDPQEVLRVPHNSPSVCFYLESRALGGHNLCRSVSRPNEIPQIIQHSRRRKKEKKREKNQKKNLLGPPKPKNAFNSFRVLCWAVRCRIRCVPHRQNTYRGRRLFRVYSCMPGSGYIFCPSNTNAQHYETSDVEIAINCFHVKEKKGPLFFPKNKIIVEIVTQF